MKKLLVVMLAMAVAVSFGSMAMAKDGLSVDLGFAWNFNGADMTKTIVKDGEEGAGTGLFGKAIMPENELLMIKNDKSNPLGIPAVSSVTDDGGMQGLNTALRVRYDFLNSFFARLGFVYDLQVAGGDDSFKLGKSNLVLNSLTNDLVTASSLVGQKVTQKWTYGSWMIPLTVGINIPVAEKYNVYAGLGLTYYSGYWQIEVKAPAGYIDTDDNGTFEIADGAAKEKAKFEVSGIGFNWTVGATADVYQDVALFIELDATIAGGMSDSVKLKSDAGKAAFGLNNVFYPVNLSTTLVRFGVNYKLPIQL